MPSFKPIDAEKCLRITEDIARLVDIIDLKELDRLNRGIKTGVFKNYRADNIKPISLVDDFCNATKATIHHESLLTYYCEGDDCIGISAKNTYFDTAYLDATENYYTDIFHELVHWTGIKHRLNRQSLEGLIYSQDLAFEEIVAELGAIYLGVQFNISRTPLLAPSSYIKRNLEPLDNNKDYINKASKKAFKAVEFLNAFNK